MQYPKPVHPFPARMAASIPWEILGAERRRTVAVLDPMAGSGTVPVVARSLGHRGTGFDVDPLAVLMASAWCADVDERLLAAAAMRVLHRAANWQAIPLEESYPAEADEATRRFVRYWFDARSRRQLAALATGISATRDCSLRALLWCAFSRLIIVKQAGASRAMDVAHSRPHRSYPSARIQPTEHFLRAIRQIVKVAPFTKPSLSPEARIERGDARRLPLPASCIDYVITSPPYLNAIDYLRGHRLSLVWMGHSVDTIRGIRTDSVGTEAGNRRATKSPEVQLALRASVENSLGDRDRGMLVRFMEDMHSVLSEIARVLKPSGRAVLVVGNCSLRGTFVQNSAGVKALANAIGLTTLSEKTRELPANRRYLPPPQNEDSGRGLAKRMREEVVLTFAHA
jgi:SAM-dependent methyltransferase